VAIRDQVMPQYRYSASACVNDTITVRTSGQDKNTKPSVLVNGHIAY
jgi:predicted nucleic acid-binding Zn ribbon protein